MAKQCKYYLPCPTRTTLKETDSERGLASLLETFCDSETNCTECPTYQFLKEEGIEFKRVVGHVKPKQD